MARKQVVIRMTTEEIEELHRQAASFGLTSSAYIRWLIHREKRQIF